MMKYSLKSFKLLIQKYPYSLLIQTLAILISMATVYIPIKLAQEVVSLYENHQSYLDMVKVVLIYCSILVVANAITIITNYYTTYIERNFKAELAIMFYQKLDKIDYDFHESPRFLNDYTRALEEGTERIYRSAYGVMNIVKVIVQSATVFLVILQMHYLAVVYAVIIGIIYALIRFRVGRLDFKALTLQRPYFRQRQYVNRTFFIKDAMADLKTTKIEEILLENNAKANDGIIDVIDKVTIKKSLYNYIGDILITSIYPVTLGVLALVTISDIKFSDFAALTIAASSLSSLVSQFVSAVGDLQNNAIECKIPFEVLDMKGKIEGVKFNDLQDQFHTIKLVNASFSYDGKHQVLKNINMKINHGEKIAIVGANGAGKTTLVKLLLRLYDTTSGDIIINNQNYKEVSVDSLRKSVGAVFQNVEVYAASIAENIIFREPKTPEDIKIVTDALAFSGLLDFVNTLSQGINTQVTREFDKNGVVFSGGQIQRLAIARGYAQAYELLILDEPSSALDPLAEAQVYQNMLKMGKEKTIVFISHRLTTTVNADRIYLFENGEIVEAGTHNELMAQNGLYKHMFNSQASKYLGGQYENN
jgi:ATP-binding cassette subfamily B protein